MGGIVGLTIRFSEGKEYRGSCHTNVLPYGLFAAPFYLDLDTSKKHVTEWLHAILANREQDPDVENLWGGHNMLAPVEYGLVVVDYVTSTLVSCQGYTGAQYIYSYAEDRDEKWQALDQAGLLTITVPERGSRPKTGEIQLPFANYIDGMERDCDRTLEAWCEKNFGLSDAERTAWVEWYKRFEEDEVDDE